jgi:hypothetical protein
MPHLIITSKSCVRAIGEGMDVAAASHCPRDMPPVKFKMRLGKYKL